MATLPTMVSYCQEFDVKNDIYDNEVWDFIIE